MTAFATDSHTAAEFRAAVESAAVFPNQAGRLKLVGEDARDLLNRLSTNLIDPDAAPGSVEATVLTSDRGRIVDLVYVAHCGDHQLLLTSPGQQQAVIEFLDKYTIMEELEVEDISEQLTMLTVTGPEAVKVVQQVTGLDASELTTPAVRTVTVGGNDSAVSLIVPPADPATGRERMGFHLVPLDAAGASSLTAALADAGAVQISADTAEVLRIARQQPLYGAEMSETYNPLEAGLIGAIDFHKGCYIGQEVIARLDTYEKVQKYLVALRFETQNDGDNVADALDGARLVDGDGKAMGLVTSTTVVPALDGESVIGLGYVRTVAAEIGNALDVVAENGEVPSGIKGHITARPQLFGGEKPMLGE